MLMIERNMIAWLVNELEATYESPFFNEWGITLLTNLCLRSAGLVSTLRHLNHINALLFAFTQEKTNVFPLLLRY